MAITTFDVIQGHRKPICDLFLCLILTYLLSCIVSKLWLFICQIFPSIRRSLHLKRPRWGWSPANIRKNFTSPETRGVVPPCRCWKPHDHIFICLDTIPDRDGLTDIRNPSGYYSALHCEKCGRAVKKWQIGIRIIPTQESFVIKQA